MHISSRYKMGSTPSFHEFKKQASFFFKEKIKTARLALTDVTSAQLLTEDAISGNPDAKTLTSISKAAFELDDYWRIVDILHQRLLKFEKKHWRLSYNSLIILEHLLTHGPESVSEEFQSDRDVISQMGSFQFVDEKGFNWGVSVRKKSERILKLLEKGSLLKEERNKARKLTREIQGFGSFPTRSTSISILSESSPSLPNGKYGKCNSNFDSIDRGEEEEEAAQTMSSKVKDLALVSKSADNKAQNQSFEESQKIEMPETEDSVKENSVPKDEDLHRWGKVVAESNPLLGCKGDEFKVPVSISISADEFHPFSDVDVQTTSSLLSG